MIAFLGQLILVHSLVVLSLLSVKEGIRIDLLSS